MYTPGDRQIDYIEFPAADLQAVKDFYSQVFGWEFTDYGPDYTSFEDGRLSGGFFQSDAPTGSGPLVVLYSTALEASLNAVQEAGATIVRETFSFPGGRRFHFRDPAGHELAIWSDQPAP